MEIKFDSIGKATVGEYQNNYIIIKDDTQGSTGGYYIYVTEDLKGDSNIFDNWYETIDPVIKFVEIYGVTWP